MLYTALEESSQCKDPFFVLELDFGQQNTDGTWTGLHLLCCDASESFVSYDR